MSSIRLTLSAFIALFAYQASADYCNWSNCNGQIQGGDWCNANQAQCLACGGGSRWCTGGPSPSPPAPSPPTSVGTSGTATTTRYWDCSGGACGCAYVPFSQNQPAHCYSNALFAAPAGNPYGAKYYGTAAVSQALGGGDWMAPACGKCWKVTGTSNAGITLPAFSTTIVLRGANYCPPTNSQWCGSGIMHFDIAAPGFDYLASSLSNTCDTVEPDEIEGFQRCGSWHINGGDCDCFVFNDATLRAGCENFLSLEWDNPTVIYEEVSCPPEMVTECGYPYPPTGSMPATCASPRAVPPPPSPTSPSPTPPSPTPSSPTPPSPTPPSPSPPSPTLPSPTPPSPTPPSLTPPSSGQGCCTNDFKTCINWCGTTKQACESCTSASVAWLPNGVQTNSCLVRWSACTNNVNGCCNGLSCDGNQYYRQCLYKGS
ncbi:hypothetical protein ACA910_003246 [Epithemia clementina (nom. ined.)]